MIHTRAQNTLILCKFTKYSPYNYLFDIFLLFVSVFFDLVTFYRHTSDAKRAYSTATDNILNACWIPQKQIEIQHKFPSSKLHQKKSNLFLKRPFWNLKKVRLILNEASRNFYETSRNFNEASRNFQKVKMGIFKPYIN